MKGRSIKSSKIKKLIHEPIICDAGFFQGFYGKFCESSSVCRHSPCQNGGSCLPGRHGYSCNCLPGTFGRDCLLVASCLSNPCQNGGRCVDERFGYTCECPSMWNGVNCEQSKVCEENECGIKANDGFCHVSYCFV